MCTLEKENSRFEKQIDEMDKSQRKEKGEMNRKMEKLKAELQELHELQKVKLEVQKSLEGDNNEDANEGNNNEDANNNGDPNIPLIALKHLDTLERANKGTLVTLARQLGATVEDIHAEATGKTCSDLVYLIFDRLELNRKEMTCLKKDRQRFLNKMGYYAAQTVFLKEEYKKLEKLNEDADADAMKIINLRAALLHEQDDRHSNTTFWMEKMALG